MGDSPAAIIFDVNGNPIGVSVDGIVYRLKVEAKEIRSVTATRTTVASATTDTLIIAANTARLNLIIYNNSDSPLYIGFGTTPVSLTNFSIFIPSRADREVADDFVGEIRGIWQSAGGEAYITEMT